LEAQPGKGAFDDPPFRQDLEAANVVAALHDLQTQTAAIAKRSHPLDERSGVATVGPDETEAHERVRESSEHELRAVAILNVAAVNDDGEDQPERVDDQMALSTLYFLARIVTAAAPREVVFTDWLSMIAADGIRSRPSLARTSPRSWS